MTERDPILGRDEVIERVQAGNRGLQLSGDGAQRHIQAMESLLNGNESETERRAGPRLLGRLRPALVTTMASLLILTLGTIGIASSNTIPGSLTYPFKRLAESPVAVFDDNIAATNRVEELEALISAGADPPTIRQAVADATDAVAKVEAGADPTSGSDLQATFDQLVWPGPHLDADRPPRIVHVNLADLTDRPYSAALPDGHLVTIDSRNRVVRIEATGPWLTDTTPQGWRLAQPEGAAYAIARIDDTLTIEPLPGALSNPNSDGTDGTGSQNRGPTSSADDETAAPPLRDPSSASAAVEGEADRSTSSPTSTTAAEDAGTATTGRPTTTERSPTTGRTTTKPVQVTGRPTTAPTTGASTTSTTRATTTTTRRATTRQPTRPTTTATTGPTTTTSRPTTTRPTTAVTTSPPAEPTSWTFRLENPGSGSSSSSRVLPLGTGSASNGALANFDTDRNDDPGLTIQKDGTGLSTSDRTKYQEWRWTSSGSSRLEGTARFTVWLAAKDYKTDEAIGFEVAVDVCDPGCSRVATGSWSGTGGSSFRSATVNLGSVARDVPAGATVRVRLVVPDNRATTDVWFAYDSAAHRSRLSID